MNPSPNKNPLQTWIVDLSGNIAVSSAGIAFLDARITSFDDKELARETLRRKRLEAAPKQDNNFKLGQSIGLLFEEIES
jgi:hypothetical protein